MNVDAYWGFVSWSLNSAPASYQPFVPTSYNTQNDFGFGYMQTPEEEDYSNEPPLLEGTNRFDSQIYRIGNWFQSHIQEDSRRFESSQINRQCPRKWCRPRRPYHLLLRSVAPTPSCRAFCRSSFLEGKNSIWIHVRLFLRRMHAHVRVFLSLVRLATFFWSFSATLPPTPFRWPR